MDPALPIIIIVAINIKLPQTQQCTHAVVDKRKPISDVLVVDWSTDVEDVEILAADAEVPPAVVDMARVVADRVLVLLVERATEVVEELEASVVLKKVSMTTR